MDLLGALDADYRRFTHAISSAAPAAQVPTCPEWSVEDLVRHLGMVYLHKAECVRLNEMPKNWPPDLGGETPRELLRRAYAEMTDEFVSRKPQSPAATWFGPDQTVGFWIRRMAQETVIHRIDAELSAGLEPLPIPEDLADDGIDEILQIFVSWASREWPEDYAEALSQGDGAARIGARVLKWDSKEIWVADTGEAAITVDGTPDALLRWLWGRAGDDAVTVTGPESQRAQLRELLKANTQ
jgi:uncharacterized protein (TIGR03083 family)